MDHCLAPGGGFGNPGTMLSKGHCLRDEGSSLTGVARPVLHPGASCKPYACNHTCDGTCRFDACGHSLSISVELLSQGHGLLSTYQGRQDLAFDRLPNLKCRSA